MSKHGFYNSLGTWVEEPCNAYCRGNHHAIVAYAAAGDGIGWVASCVERDNPHLRVLQVVPAPEAPRCSAARNSGRGPTIPVLLVFAEGRQP
jgi:DNA-binding transcriptional LysR family regulator